MICRTALAKPYYLAKQYRHMLAYNLIPSKSLSWKGIFPCDRRPLNHTADDRLSLSPCHADCVSSSTKFTNFHLLLDRFLSMVYKWIYDSRHGEDTWEAKNETTIIQYKLVEKIHRKCETSKKCPHVLPPIIAQTFVKKWRNETCSSVKVTWNMNN